MTSTLLVAASNLTNNVGLAANTTMTSLCNTVLSYPLVSNYANLQPGTTYGNTLSSNSFSVTSLGLPLFVANANTTVASIQTQASKLIPNVATFATLVQLAGTFSAYSYSSYKSLHDYSGATFDTLGIHVNNHSDAVTNSISSIFGGKATNASDIRNNITTLANAIANFGTLYDVSKLNKLGDPVTFVQHLIDSGYDFTPPSDWKAMTGAELKYYLNSIIGPVFTRVMTLSNFKVPAGQQVSSLGDFLELSKVFPAQALALVPGKNFAGLANMFVNLGGRFKSFADIAAMLKSIQVPTLTYLNSYTTPVASIDFANLTAQLGKGTGVYNNPTVTDLIGTAAGVVHIGNLTTVSSTLTTVSATAAGQSLIDCLANLAVACASGNNTYITSNIAIVRNAANIFNADSTVVSSTAGNTAITNIQTQLSCEASNLSKAGISLDAVPTSGVTSVMGLVNSLHDYGVDSSNLNYNALFAGTVQRNVGGDAVLAALAEGQNINNQAQYGVPIGTKIA